MKIPPQHVDNAVPMRKCIKSFNVCTTVLLKNENANIKINGIANKNSSQSRVRIMPSSFSLMCKVNLNTVNNTQGGNIIGLRTNKVNQPKLTPARQLAGFYDWLTTLDSRNFFFLHHLD